VNAQSPELLGLITELKDRLAELRDRIAPLRLFVLKTVASSSTREIDDDIVDYLEVKQQLLLSYCINVTFYLFMKAQGQSVRAHPVMKQLLELRYFHIMY
jgi:U3 small nucleolar RNA-associated protein 3